MEHRYIKVAVIGRPNVGKSTLFNRILGVRRSIVDDTPGVTRDRLYADIEWSGKGLTLIDTGGIVDKPLKKIDVISREVKKQAFIAVENSNFVIFMVDGRSGITKEDTEIASYLRKIKDKKKIFLAVNKIDNEKEVPLIYEFYSLGLGDPYPISALNGSSGLAEILDDIAKISKSAKPIETKKEEPLKIAIVGKPNVGKSSILNCLLGEERAIVMPEAGTTRDSLDSYLTVFKKDYILIDTAGLRRKSKIGSAIERYATIRAIGAIERADVVLLVTDVTNPISDQDQKIASVIKRREKPSVILANKWDLIENKTQISAPAYEETILRDLHFIGYSKVLFTSALEKKNLHKIWKIIDEVCENNSKRISTGKLNKAIEEIYLISSPPSKKGKQLKIYYVTQAAIKPPEIVFFVNDSLIASNQYQKFLEKEIRNRFDFSGTPLKLVFRNKKE